MKALVTGAAGLVGSASVKVLLEQGYEVSGLDKDLRGYFFGPEGSTISRYFELAAEIPMYNYDIRDFGQINWLVGELEPDLIIHAAAQPSHDWAAKEPHTDFAINAVGTLNLLEAVRQNNLSTAFAHISTSKVYGDTPNRLPLVEKEDRLDLEWDHQYFHGIDTTMSIDQSLHSLFGVSKASGDLLVQEYGRYFGIPTVCFRPGCVTGGGHASVELHGFLSYLMKCVFTGRVYKIFGYGGKQVRCNIHAEDLARACIEWHKQSSVGAVYNIGGDRYSACSIIEAGIIAERLTGQTFNTEYIEEARIGDHKWWISNNKPFQADYPGWYPRYTVKELLLEILNNYAY